MEKTLARIRIRIIKDLIYLKTVSGSEEEHRGTYYLGRINNYYLEKLIQGITGGCYKTLHGDISEAFHYAVDTVSNWDCDNNNLSIAESGVCHMVDAIDGWVVYGTAGDLAKCGLEIVKNDALREL